LSKYYYEQQLAEIKEWKPTVESILGSGPISEAALTWALQVYDLKYSPYHRAFALSIVGRSKAISHEEYFRVRNELQPIIKENARKRSVCNEPAFVELVDAGEEYLKTQ
jgi:hypothetical protein